MNTQDSDSLTQHALLVLWGQFAQSLGLVTALMQLPLAQKTYTHRPQTKVMEFLLAVLAGLPYLKDLSKAAHPLDEDTVVAHAWGQTGWADYSGVSRTLSALTSADVQRIQAVFSQVSRPFIDREVMLAMRQSGRLVFDLDLSGRPVSRHSTTYPEATFGHMDDGIQFGYQAAIVSLHSPTYGRICLSASHHPGNTHSSTLLPALVAAAEAQTGVRPRRRTDLLRQRLDALSLLQQSKQTLVDQQQVHLQRQQEKLQALAGRWQEQQTVLSHLPAAGPARQRARAQQCLDRLSVAQRRQEKVIATAQRGLGRHQHALQAVQAEHRVLSDRLAQFELDNAQLTTPVSAIIRVDAGFSTSENLALLIEAGYEVYTKPCSAQIISVLLRRLPADAIWTAVGADVEMTACEPGPVGDCPYALDIALGRVKVDERWEHIGLLHYGADPVASQLPEWFQSYNARQTIEAGIKEGKQVFQMHHLKVRTAPALEFQECCAAFAANFVRWAAHWLEQAPDPTAVSGMSIKTQVQVLAHTSALIVVGTDGYVAHFTAQSVLAGKTLTAPVVAVQRPLPFYTTRSFAPN